MQEDETSALLARHGISTQDYGKGGALSVADLAREIDEGVCSLEADEAGGLIRHVSIAEVSLIAVLPRCRLVLVNEDVVLDDGRRRPRKPQQAQQRLHIKLRRNEGPVAGAHRALLERLSLEGGAAKAALGLPVAAKAEASCGGTGEAACSFEPDEVVEAVSSSYPGLRTRYAVQRVELHLPASERCRGSLPRQETADPDREALLEQLGLPIGRTFLTVEGKLGDGGGGRVHLWRWALAESEQERRFSDLTSEFTALTSEDLQSEIDEFHQDPTQPEEELTPLEQADRDVRAVLGMLQMQKASLYERGTHLETQLTSAQDRLRRVLRRFSNVEGLVSLNTNNLFKAKVEDKKASKRLSSSLVLFLQNNFSADGNNLDKALHLPQEEQEAGATNQDDAGGTAPRRRAASGQGRSTSPLREGLQGVLSEVHTIREQGGEQSWVLDCLEMHQHGRRAMLAIAELHLVPNASDLGTSEGTLRRFTSMLHRKYEENPNPFHNEAHAATVCHSTHWLAARGRACAAQSEGLQVVTDIAALAHDVGHFGRNNLFCLNKGNELAMMYNDRSILENMHASTCFRIMQGTGCNILKDCSLANRKKYREHMVDLILATDMSTHFDFFGKFRMRAASPEFSPQDNAEDRRMVMRCYLKAADLGHAALPWEMHERWALRLLTEFYEQGDEERRLGMPISPMCERTGNAAEFCESQKGFLEFVITPLFKELVPISLPEVGETCITRLEVNAEEWIKLEPSPELVAIIKGPARTPSRALKKEVSFDVQAVTVEESSESSDP